MADQPDGRRTRLRVRGFHWYSSAVGSEARRRPTDLVLLVGCLLGLLLLLPAAPGPTDLDVALTSAIQALPTWLLWVFSVGYALSAIWALVLLVVPLVTPHRRVLTAWLVLAALVAFGLAGVAGSLAGTGWDRSWGALWTTDPPPDFTAVRVAVITSVVVAASPHLGKPIRLVGRTILGVVAVSAVAIDVAHPIGALAGILVGVAAAALVHLIVGSPAGRPSPARVVEALDDLGLPGAEVDALAAPGVGAATFLAHVPDRPQLLVAVLGRDEWDAQSLTSAWTAATRRGEHLSVSTTRLARAEHAALMALFAERAGVGVLSVVGAGRSAEGDALLVTEAPEGPALTELAPEEITDDLLDRCWAQLRSLHGAGIAHRRINGARIFVDSQHEPALTDFGNATAAASRHDIMVDRARLMVAIALTAGSDRAVASAQRVLGHDGLVELLPYLQPAVLDRETRARIRDGEWDVSGLRDRAVATAGVEAPPLEQVRRVTPRSLVRAALIAVISYGLVSALSGVNLTQVWDELSSADWAWLAAALVVSPLTQLLSAFSTIGAATAALRYVPVMVLQFALQFIALALPATAARVAMDVRFFQSFGIASGAAVSIGMIDSFSGFLIQVLLLLVIMLSGLPGFTQPLSTGSGGTDSGSASSGPSLFALTIALGLVSLLVVLLVPRLRRQSSARLRAAWTAFGQQAREARGALDVLRHPAKVLEMVGGNLGAQVVQAVVLGLCLAAFGKDAALSQLILINTAVSLFAGMMPVPGGVGVAEAGYTAGLEAIGIPGSIALSTAIAFRLVTFYLPPLWGSVAMRWLRRHSYV